MAGICNDLDQSWARNKSLGEFWGKRCQRHIQVTFYCGDPSNEQRLKIPETKRLKITNIKQSNLLTRVFYFNQSWYSIAKQHYGS